MHKKRLNVLTFDAIREVALHFIGGWMVFDADAEPALDKEFLGSLKCLKALQERDKEHRNIVCSRLKDLPEQVFNYTKRCRLDCVIPRPGSAGASSRNLVIITF